MITITLSSDKAGVLALQRHIGAPETFILFYAGCSGFVFFPQSNLMGVLRDKWLLHFMGLGEVFNAISMVFLRTPFLCVVPVIVAAQILAICIPKVRWTCHALPSGGRSCSPPASPQVLLRFWDLGP